MNGIVCEVILCCWVKDIYEIYGSIIIKDMIVSNIREGRSGGYIGIS